MGKDENLKVFDIHHHAEDCPGKYTQFKETPYNVLTCGHIYGCRECLRPKDRRVKQVCPICKTEQGFRFDEKESPVALTFDTLATTPFKIGVVTKTPSLASSATSGSDMSLRSGPSSSGSDEKKARKRKRKHPEMGEWGFCQFKGDKLQQVKKKETVGSTEPNFSLLRPSLINCRRDTKDGKAKRCYGRG